MHSGNSTRIFLVGHAGFWNRGCEAIIRSTSVILHNAGLKCDYDLWSLDPAPDARQLEGEPFHVWPRFPPRSFLIRALGKLGRSGLPIAGKLSLNLERSEADRWEQSLGTPDAVISVGGDNYSLDYGPPQHFVDIGEHWMERKRPFVVWGASIGPFSADPIWEEKMADFLQRVDLITARESVTVNYLAQLGVSKNVQRVWDPAFCLPVYQYHGPETALFEGRDVLGLNISALIAKWFPDQAIQLMLKEVAAFAQEVTAAGIGIMLIPHVTNTARSQNDNDFLVLSQLKGMLKDRNKLVDILPADTPATQIKHVIARCRWFIGARTHSTIAAVSSGVPTIAIAYSQKARGIWRDIFGHDDFLLPTRDLSRDSLMEKWTLLRSEESRIRQTLADKRGEMTNGALQNAVALKTLIRQ